MIRSWHEQREEIGRALNRLFIRRIDVAPRAMAALQVHEVIDQYTDELPSGFEITVLENLLKSSAACATLLIKAGVSIEAISFPETRPRPAILADSTLDWIFKGVGTSGFTERAKRVRASGCLDEIDLLISGLEASLRGQEPNDGCGAILEAAGLSTTSHVPPAKPEA